ncbi:MAG: hypothetical protein ABGX16_03395 [Pirellulales bacterium]
MKAHPTDLASAMLPIAKVARGRSLKWRAAQKSEQESASELRSRLLKMIVTNEQLRTEEQSNLS